MAEQKKNTVAVIMGSKTDWSILEYSVKTLWKLGVKSTVNVLSAHRTPHEAVEFAQNAAGNGYKVLIGAAGGAAHLCGVLAAHTILPIIGVPLKGWALDGLDSLLSTVQMPRGVPVATVSVGKAGAVNAAILAVQIMAVSDPVLREKLTAYKKQMTAEVLKTDAELRSELNDCDPMRKTD